MKIKNIIIASLVKIEYKEISLEEYWPSMFDDVGYEPNEIKEELFYKIGNYAVDLKNFKGYKIIKEQEEYPNELRGKKRVMYKRPFTDIYSKDKISRKDAISIYSKSKIK